MDADGRLTTARCSDSRSSVPRSTSTPLSSLPQLLGYVGGDPGVRGGGGGEHRDIRGQRRKQRPDPAVIGPEVVAPVGDAVRLIDNDQACRLREMRQDVVAESRVVQPLGADEQDVHGAVTDLGVHLLPLFEVRRVDRARVDTRPRRGIDLVAHQREQRRDDDRRPGAAGAQQRGRDEVHRRLSPPGPLHHECPAVLRDEGVDRGPLVVPQPCVLARERPKVRLGSRAHVRGPLGGAFPRVLGVGSRLLGRHLLVFRHGSSAIRNGCSA